MRTARYCLAVLCIGVTCLVAQEAPAAAVRPRLADGTLVVGSQRLVIRGVSYSNAAIGERGGAAYGGQSCRFARDLPVIAAMGANTVRTRALVPEDDAVFVSVLDTTGLYWIADFPLDPYYDPSQTLGAKRDEILRAFHNYVMRFRGNARLLGYIFGDEVLDDYNRNFAGSVEDFYALLGEAAELLRTAEPQDTPLLATAVRDPDRLRSTPPGLSFWALNASGTRNFTSVLEAARRNTRLPILVSEFGIDAFDRLSGREDEEAQAAAAVALARQIETSANVLGGIYFAFLDEWWREGFDPSRHVAGVTLDPSFPDGYRNDAWAGLFRVAATEAPGLDALEPRRAFWALASAWNGAARRIPQVAPRLDGVVNAATGKGVTSPVALVRLSGEGLVFQAQRVQPWAFHADVSCVCIDGLPAKVASATPQSATAVTPATLAPGIHRTVVFRLGAASNFAPVRVERHAPGIFASGVLRAGTDCLVSEVNGARRGEILEIYLTGLGSGPFEALEVEVNGTTAEILYAGALEAYPGMNQINVRVPTLAPRGSGSLLVRLAEAISNPYALSVAGETDQPAISVGVPAADTVLQAGGPEQTAPVEVEGRNGYCGPVLFRIWNPPEGISLRSAMAFTGRPAFVRLRAAPGARPVNGGLLTLLATAPGAATGSANLRLTVLPSRGDIQVRVVSGGYKAGPLAQFDWAGRTLHATTGGGPGRGINVLTVDPQTGLFSPVRSFDTWGDPAAASRLTAFLNELPSGTIALFAIADEGTYQLDLAAKEAIRIFFGSRLIRTLGYQDSWALIGRKGAASPLAEGASSDKRVVLDYLLTLPAP